MVDKSIVAKSIEHYGIEDQSTVCIEECAELIQAISKEKRGMHNENHLAEEIADVEICIEMIKQMFDVRQEVVDAWIYTKQKREVERMSKGIA